MKTIRSLVLVSLIFPPFVSAVTVAPGDLIITEVMADPNAVSDTAGEWFELHNLTANSLNLDGLILSDSDSNMHEIDNGGSLFIDPFGYLVLGRNGNMVDNGGYTPDYVYSDFVLSNTDDEIIITSNGVEIIRLEYIGGFALSGISRELVGTVGLSLDNTSFTSSTRVYGDGDYGTPGEAGDSAWKLDVRPVPVPAAVWLFGSGLVWLFGIKKQRSVDLR